MLRLESYGVNCIHFYIQNNSIICQEQLVKDPFKNLRLFFFFFFQSLVNRFLSEFDQGLVKETKL